MKDHVLVMRFGATSDDIVIGGHTFDRGGLTTREQGGLRGGPFRTFRHMVIDALIDAGRLTSKGWNR